MRATTRNRRRRSAVAALSVVTLGASLVLAATSAAADGPSAAIIVGEVNEENGLRQIEQGDGTTAPVTVGGLSARATVQTSAPAEHMYFQVDDAVAFDGSSRACRSSTSTRAGPHSASSTTRPAARTARRVR
jgi:cytochrome c-type biogenesis protein CcmE